jgi:hypothetical protein
LCTWFVQDDFGWLALRHLVKDGPSFLWAMFAPLAQGTIRPWSERGFFLLFSWLFGLHALPFRIFVFLNQAINIALVTFLTWEITRSDAAAILAPLLWLANPVLALPMAWTSAYNEIQCATFLMLSLSLFIRFAKTENRTYLWAQYAAFGLGFGSNELNVVYPALAAAYALFFARRYLATTKPLFAASALFILADRWAASPAAGAYAMDFHPAAILHTLLRYGAVLFSGLRTGAVFGWAPWAIRTGEAVSAVIAAGLIIYAAWRARQRDYVSLFGLCWFLLVLAPVLLLPHHVTDYYLLIPSIGVAIAGASAIARSWKGSPALAAVVTILGAIYLVISSAESYRQMTWHFQRAERARVLVQGVAEAKRRHPGKIVLLENVDEQLFWAAVYDRPFARIFGWHDVFLTPESRAQIPSPPNDEPLDGYFFPPSATRSAMADQSATVWSFHNDALQETTAAYASLANAKPPPPLDASLDVGQPYMSRQLGDGWFDAGDGVR